MKALLMNTWSGNSHYKDFKLFTTNKITWHLDLYFMLGINLSPQVSNCINKITNYILFFRLQ